MYIYSTTKFYSILDLIKLIQFSLFFSDPFSVLNMCNLLSVIFISFYYIL